MTDSGAEVATFAAYLIGIRELDGNSVIAFLGMEDVTRERYFVAARLGLGGSDNLAVDPAFCPVTSNTQTTGFSIFDNTPPAELARWMDELGWRQGPALLKVTTKPFPGKRYANVDWAQAVNATVPLSRQLAAFAREAAEQPFRSISNVPVFINDATVGAAEYGQLPVALVFVLLVSDTSSFPVSTVCEVFN